MAKGRTLSSRLRSRIIGSCYPVSLHRRNSSFPTSALSRDPSFSCQPLTSSRASSFLLTESLKPQLFPTGSPDMAAPGWCDGPKMLTGTQTPWIFLLHHPPAMATTFSLHFKASHLRNPTTTSILPHCPEPGHIALSRWPLDARETGSFLVVPLFPTRRQCSSLSKVVEQVGMKLLTCNICHTECYLFR